MNLIQLPLIMAVCTGNVCRSPLAETLLRHYIQVNGLRATVISRGLAAPVGRPPHKYAIEVAEKYGVPLPSEKRAEAVSRAELRAATLVLVMDSLHRRDIQRQFPEVSGKVFLIGQWANQEIADPINMPYSAFEIVWHQIDMGARDWVERLKTSGLVTESTGQLTKQ